MRKYDVRKNPYPPDKGLGSPLREFKDTYSVFELLKKEFFTQTVTPPRS